ncbi:hypothetical protein [Psychrobacter frigidicola]|uniref:hypothetical protein n=1 Tax=Psychrobacter frigidicola TaxID=45611 RepID=UPI00191AA27F|nr:hypothetical protein [Psychrobacter frigidicola]
MDNQSKDSDEYQVRHPILDVMGKILLNVTITGLLLGFGFWLLLASNMGPAYLPNIMDGALDMWIRFSMIGIAAIIWIVSPIWFLWSSARFGYDSYHGYQASKRIK